MTAPSAVYGPPGFATGGWLAVEELWQLPRPESRNAWPWTGMKSQRYWPAPSVILSTQYLPVLLTALVAQIVPNPLTPTPPVPTVIWRIPNSVSTTPAGV